MKTMKDCSVVTATYELGEGMKGTIGIIGPKRMDYEHVMKIAEDVCRMSWMQFITKTQKNRKGGIAGGREDEQRRYGKRSRRGSQG